MVDIMFELRDGSRRSVAATEGSLMEVAIYGNVDGIDGECGGSLSCATCHVYLMPADADRIPPPSADEEALLEAVSAERRPTSRLSCQIDVGALEHGITVLVPG